MRRTRPVLLVAAGGAAGTLLRYAASADVSGDRLRLVTSAVNLAGALALGLLVGRGPGPSMRLVLGTGLLGALTTWSGLAVGTALLVRDGRPLAATGYALLSVAGGLAVAAAGVAVGRRLAGGHLPRRDGSA